MLGENRHRRDAGRPAANRLVSCGFRICVIIFGSVFAYVKLLSFGEFWCAKYKIKIFVSGSVCEGSVKTLILRSVCAPNINLF